MWTELRSQAKIVVIKVARICKKIGCLYKAIILVVVNNKVFMKYVGRDSSSKKILKKCVHHLWNKPFGEQV